MDIMSLTFVSHVAETRARARGDMPSRWAQGQWWFVWTMSADNLLYCLKEILIFYREVFFVVNTLTEKSSTISRKKKDMISRNQRDYKQTLESLGKEILVWKCIIQDEPCCRSICECDLSKYYCSQLILLYLEALNIVQGHGPGIYTLTVNL